ncbi:MAG: YlxR family protein [Acidimicrobiales bacterium]
MGCRRVAPQDELVRIVRCDDGTVRAGRTLPGRGAWLCAASPACLQRAARRGALSRALRGDVDGAAVLARGWEGLQ